MSDLICLFPVLQLALEVRGGQGPGELHAGLDAPPERIIAGYPNRRALLRVEKARKFSIRPAAVLFIRKVGSVSDVVVNKLAHLHHQEGVGVIRIVGTASHEVTNLSGGRKLQSVSCPLPRMVQTASSVLREKNPLEWCSSPSIIWIFQVVTRSIECSE